MKIGFKQFALSTALTGVLAPLALAQTPDNPFERGRYTSVTERRQEAYDPEPIRVGTFDLWSSLGLYAEFNDNVRAEESFADEDTIFRIRPEAELRSNWSSHALAIGGAVDHQEYSDLSEETRTDYNAFARGRIDVRRSLQLHGQVIGEHNTEQRYEPGSQGTLEPAEYDVFGVEAGPTFQTDRLLFEGRVGTRNTDFDDVDFNFRDNDETYYRGRASYAVSPDVALFVQGRHAEFDYDAPPVTVPPTPNRDGTRSSVEVGATFELQAPFRGEIAVGTTKDEKDDPAINDSEGLSLAASVMWFPTQITTVTFRGDRYNFDPGILQSPTATNTSFGVRVDHELRRNILLFGEASTGKYEYEDINREDKYVNAAIGAGYKLNKHARLEASYRFHDRREEQPPAITDRDITQQIFSIGVRIFP
jgi:hypothetical protein